MHRLHDTAGLWQMLRCMPCALCFVLNSASAAADDALHTAPANTLVEPDTPDEVERASEPRIYQTREEQREAGLKRQITPWLTVSGLVEAEISYDEYRTAHGEDEQASQRDDSATLQLGVIAELLADTEVEVILEYDTDTRKVEVDEAIFVIEHDPWELSIGRQYTPFGTYISSFVSGPLIEFGETRSHRAVTLAYGPSDHLDALLTLYRGEARKREDGSRQWDLALGIEADIGEHWSAGWSYQSDLADADSRPLADENDRYRRRISGISAFVQWSNERISASVEGLAATQSYDELEGDRDRPAAWNSELVYFFAGHELELAFRLEGSNEIEDEPHLRYGAAATWRFGRHSSLSVEYLRGEFKGDLATDDDDRPYDTVDRVAAMLAMEF